MVGVMLYSAFLLFRLCTPVHPAPAPSTPTHPTVRNLPRMNGPALLALFPEIPLPRAFALADVSPAPLSDALRFILSSRQDRKELFSLSKSASFLTLTQTPSL